MGTLVFMPWATIDRKKAIGEFELLPVALDPDHSVPLEGEAWRDPSDDVRRILGAYRDPPDIKISSATAIHLRDRSRTADLSESEIDASFLLSEVIAFCGLATRQFFSYGGYCNRDSFTLIGQRFVEGRGGVSLVKRRRDGRATTYVPEEFNVIRREAHIEDVRPFPLDEAFANALLNEVRTNQELEQCVRSFNEANTDRSSTSQAQEIVSTMSAFEQLLGVRNGDCNESRKRFAAFMASIPAGPTQPAKPEALKRMQTGRSLREVWLQDLCALRGNVAHGHPVAAYPAIWTPGQHLLIAAYLLPALVRLYLAQRALVVMTDADQSRLTALDDLLASADVMGGEKDANGVPMRYEWNKVLSEVDARQRRQRALEALSKRAGP
jgi:hypothetical protein